MNQLSEELVSFEGLLTLRQMFETHVSVGYSQKGRLGWFEKLFSLDQGAFPFLSSGALRALLPHLRICDHFVHCRGSQRYYVIA